MKNKVIDGGGNNQNHNLDSVLKYQGFCLSAIKKQENRNCSNPNCKNKLRIEKNNKKLLKKSEEILKEIEKALY